jgi:hypothetical protein
VGRYLQRVFKDGELGYAPEHFPPPPPGLKTRWNCPTPWPKDTLDSAKADTSKAIPVPQRSLF